MTPVHHIGTFMTKSSSHSPQTNKSITHQLNREAKWSLYLTLVYLAGWVIGAYFAPDGQGLFGFPLWFELSCVFLPILFIVVSLAVLKLIYKEVDLDTDLTDKEVQ